MSPVPVLLELAVPVDAPLMVQQSHATTRQLGTDSYLTVHNATLTITTQHNDTNQGTRQRHTYG